MTDESLKEFIRLFNEHEQRIEAVEDVERRLDSLYKLSIEHERRLDLMQTQLNSLDEKINKLDLPGLVSAFVENEEAIGNLRRETQIIAEMVMPRRHSKPGKVFGTYPPVIEWIVDKWEETRRHNDRADKDLLVEIKQVNSASAKAIQHVIWRVERLEKPWFLRWLVRRPS